MIKPLSEIKIRLTIIIYYYFCNHRWSVLKCCSIFIISFGYLLEVVELSDEMTYIWLKKFNLHAVVSHFFYPFLLFWKFKAKQNEKHLNGAQILRCHQVEEKKPTRIIHSEFSFIFSNVPKYMLVRYSFWQVSKFLEDLCPI